MRTLFRRIAPPLAGGPTTGSVDGGKAGIGVGVGGMGVPSPEVSTGAVEAPAGGFAAFVPPQAASNSTAISVATAPERTVETRILSHPPPTKIGAIDRFPQARPCRGR